MVECEFFVACDECRFACFWGYNRKEVIKEAKAHGWYVNLKEKKVYCPQHKPTVVTVKPGTAVSSGEERGFVVKLKSLIAKS